MIPVGGLVHMGLAWAFRNDPEIFSLYSSYEAHPNTWTAGNGIGNESLTSRPKGYFREGGK